MYEACNDRKALGRLGFVRRMKFKVSIGLEFLRSLAEHVSQTFTKLQLSFALCRIAIGESLLADVSDGGDNLLKFRDSTRDLLDERSFGSGPLLLCRAYSCHGRVKKV